MLFRILMATSLALVLTLVACADDVADTDDGAECTTAADCPVTTGAPFMPSCEGDVLTTLGGSGELQCVEGQCSWDSYEEETDCAAEGKVCGYPPESGAAASACMDPPDSEE